jgi:hypothetical protein
VGSVVSLGTTVWLASFVLLGLAKVYKPIWRYRAATLGKGFSAHMVRLGCGRIVRCAGIKATTSSCRSAVAAPVSATQR